MKEASLSHNNLSLQKVLCSNIILNFYSEFREKEYKKFIQLLKATLDIICTNKVQENMYCLIEFKRWDDGTKYLGDISTKLE